MKKLAVLFPGANYNTDCPLLYYCDFICDLKGYERISIKYDNILKNEGVSLADRISTLREYELRQLKAIEFENYSEVLFISKSIGTLEAVWISDKLGIDVKHIFITPIKETLPQILGRSCKVIAGTKDSILPKEILEDFCRVNNIKCLFIEGADHSLEIPNDPIKSIDRLKEVVSYVKDEVGD